MAKKKALVRSCIWCPAYFHLSRPNVLKCPECRERGHQLVQKKENVCQVCAAVFFGYGYDRQCVACRPGEKSQHATGRGRVRYLARARDKFTCQDCGEVRTPEDIVAVNKGIIGLRGRFKHLDVHHKDGQCGKNTRGYDKKEDIHILITLCHRCHFRRHDFSKRLQGEWGELTKEAIA